MGFTARRGIFDFFFKLAMGHRDEVRHLILAVSGFCDDMFVREVVGLAIFRVQRPQLFEFF
jgi:hypothetical protein